MKKATSAALFFYAIVCNILVSCKNTKSLPENPTHVPIKTSQGQNQPPNDDDEEYANMRERRKAPCGVYLDGKPIGFLYIAELPPKIPVTWEYESYELIDKPGAKPKTYFEKKPRYRVTDYLKYLRVNLTSVKAVHIHNGRGYVAAIAAEELQTHGDKLLFRFAGGDRGRPLPIFMPGLKTSNSFDSMSFMSVYVENPVPKIDDRNFSELEGTRVQGVPYFGKPLGNGLRVYYNDRLLEHIKRKQLQTGPGNQMPDTNALVTIIQAKQVDPKKLKKAVLIYDNQRYKELDAKAIAVARFVSPDEDADFQLDVSGTLYNLEALSLY